jgi:excisionase family DNA binding protein
MTPEELRGRLFIGVPEAAAEVFEVDERTVRRAIADGQIPGVKIGNKTLIPVPKLLALLGVEYHGQDHGGDEQTVSAGQGDESRGLRVLPHLVRGGTGAT